MLVFLIVAGLILGSFVNATVWRLHEQAALRERAVKKSRARDAVRLRELSIIQGRSMCPNCGHRLAAKDLVPVLSWLWLRGKCRYCGRRIDDTPLPEIGLACLFAVSYLYWPFTLHGAGLFQFVLWLIFLTAFMALAVYDLRWLLLPDRIVYPLAVIAALQVITLWIGYGEGLSGVAGSIFGVAIIAGLFYVLFRISDGMWIGGGDVKLGIVLGLLAGGPVRSMLVLFAASCSGLIAMLPFLLTGRAGNKSQIPFGPFLIFGLILDVLFGDRLVHWYMRLLG